MSEKIYKSIVNHYEACLEKHGDTHLGVDWPNSDDVNTRYKVMLDIVLFVNDAKGKYSLLDFGCGAAHLLEYSMKNNYSFEYSGLDLSPKFVSLCRKKYPNSEFFVLDVLDNPDGLKQYDFVVMNGVFTEKRDLTFDQMFDYFQKMIKIVFSKAKCGIAFNVMSKEVDWERDDLFHLPHDPLVKFLIKNCSRNYIIRNDYGLHEYTVYLYK